MLVWLTAACTNLPEDPLPIDEAFDGHFTFEGTSVEYYEVYGEDRDSLKASLAREAPSLGAARHRAYTTWDIRWQYGWREDSCDLSQPQIFADITVTLPHWGSEGRADLRTRAEWQRYVFALAEHERGHVEIIRAHLPEIRAAIRAATCQTADDAGHAVLDALRAANARYDEETRSGHTQGASFAAM